MKIEAYKCDSCGTIIKDEQGFIFKGNVCIISSTTNNGGIIGNCINEDGVVYRELHYCKPCTIRILEILRDRTT